MWAEWKLELSESALNFASIDMCWSWTYIHLPELLYENDNCVGVNEKAVEWMQDYCKPNTNTYHSTRNSTLDPIVKSKFPAHVFHPCTLMKVDCHNLRRQITLYLNDSEPIFCSGISMTLNFIKKNEMCTFVFPDVIAKKLIW